MSWFGHNRNYTAQGAVAFPRARLLLTEGGTPLSEWHPLLLLSQSCSAGSGLTAPLTGLLAAQPAPAQASAAERLQLTAATR